LPYFDQSIRLITQFLFYTTFPFPGIMFHIIRQVQMVIDKYLRRASETLDLLFVRIPERMEWSTLYDETEELPAGSSPAALAPIVQGPNPGETF
jgi:hypothetical protein